MSQQIAGRFEIHERIGQGGMGDVFRGVDTLTGEAVAIKLLKPEIVADNPELVERFTREGEALRKLNHPSIVKMLATAVEGGQHYIIMEYVGGGTLADLLREQPQLPIERVLDIALDLADALTRAHRLKIIHRDIKPQNVMLADDDTPRLTDFGVAQMGDRTRVTETGLMIGTYAYMSPEACQGEDLDTRTDIWAFGVLLYEMLAGRRPYEDKHPAAILTAIITKPIPDLLQFRPDAPPQLVSLIYAMLDKDRSKRISSVRLVGAELEALIRGSDTAIKRREKLFADPEAAATYSTPSPTPRAGEYLEDTPTITNPPEPVELVIENIMQEATAGGRSLPMKWLAIAGGLIVLFIAAVLILPGLLNPAAAPTQGAPLTVEPVDANEYMVLVAQLEQLGGETRDISRFIVDDLTQHLEDEVSYSNISIRAYPAVITSDDDALAAAEANGAPIVIWGNYDDSGATLEVQIGSLADFPDNPFERDMLEETANVRVHMTDARRESVAPQVLGIMNLLHTTNSDVFEISRNLVILDVINVTPAEIVGNSAAAQWHRYFAAFLHDTPSAIESIDAAIEMDARNPMFYIARSLVRQRDRQFDAARRDAVTAQELGPDDWAAPLVQFGHEAMFFQDDLPAALDYYSQFLAIKPDDWFITAFRGIIHYRLGDYDLARADLEHSISLGAKANFPYPYLVALALREGRMTDARTLFHTVLTQFPDPELANRLLEAVYGSAGENSFYGWAISAFGNTTLRQWDTVVEDADNAVAAGYRVDVLYLLQGFAYCNLGDYPAAEAAYTSAIELDPDMAISYVLRAEVRLRQLNLLGANDDAVQARTLAVERGLGDEIATYVDGGLAGEVSCENFFDWDPNAQ